MQTVLLFLSNLQQHSLALLGVGVILVVAVNLLLWRKDLARARRFAQGSQNQPILQSSTVVSILVAAWNEEAHIQKHIESFLRLRYPHKELVLCAGGTDQTLAIAQRYAAENIILFEQQRGEGKQNALRRGLAHARGEVIFLTDADCYLDDASFERTLAPVLSGGETAATGTTLPTQELLKRHFVASQAVVQLYGVMHIPHYVGGIFGRNSAIRRDLVEQTHAFTKSAPTGTDYVLAKTLLAHGCMIRHVPHSQVRTEYHTHVIKYLQQQRRWSWNVYYYGRLYGAQGEAHRAMLNAVVGLIMLLLPLSFLCGLNPLSALWVVLFLHALCSRWRYLAAVKCGYGLALPRGMMLYQPLMLLVDFAAWARPLADFIFKTGKERW